MTRPANLRVVPLAEVLPPRGAWLYVTCAPGQWDGLLAAAYESGAVLLEVGGDGRPARAFRKAAPFDTPVEPVEKAGS